MDGLFLTLFDHQERHGFCIMKSPAERGFQEFYVVGNYACCSRSTDDPPPRFATKFT
jgi:hypothetical protein